MDDPPAYDNDTQLGASEDREALHAFRMFAESSPICDGASADRVERLRYFLVVNLVRDYDCDANLTLDTATTHHFCTLGNMAARLSQRRSKLTEEQRVVFGRYFHTRVIDPARALGMSPEYVLRCIRCFAHETHHHPLFLDYDILEGGRLALYLRNHGTEPLARKFYTDEHSVIPNIVENLDLRAQLLEHLRKVKDHYFVSIDGIDTEVFATPSGSTTFYLARFEPTAVAKAEAERKSRIFDTQAYISPSILYGKSPLNFLARVAGCFSELRKRDAKIWRSLRRPEAELSKAPLLDNPSTVWPLRRNPRSDSDGRGKAWPALVIEAPRLSIDERFHDWAFNKMLERKITV